jgi:hypothetical protein
MSSSRKLKRNLERNPEVVKKINDFRIQKETDRMIQKLIFDNDKKINDIAATNVATNHVTKTEFVMDDFNPLDIVKMDMDRFNPDERKCISTMKVTT